MSECENALPMSRLWWPSLRCSLCCVASCLGALQAFFLEKCNRPLVSALSCLLSRWTRAYSFLKLHWNDVDSFQRQLVELPMLRPAPNLVLYQRFKALWRLSEVLRLAVIHLCLTALNQGIQLESSWLGHLTGLDPHVVIHTVCQVVTCAL